MSSASSFSSELVEAHTELWNLSLSYLKSIALQCAINLGIPNAIFRCGGSVTLTDLLSIIPVPEHRKPYVRRLMRFLAATGIVTHDVLPVVADDNGAGNGEAGGVYRLTPVSRLLVDDDNVCLTNGRQRTTSLSPFVLSQITKYGVTASMHLSEWFTKGGGEEEEQQGPSSTPFVMAHGTDVWDAMRRDPEVSELFNAGMACDSRFVLDFVTTRYSEVFDGVSSLVDVGGGAGGAAQAIAEAFPHVKCSVLDLPTVISSVPLPTDGAVEYIAGDMMESIPPTDAVLLKYVLHDWNDEDCVKILTQCKKAICTRKTSGGKVLVIDIVMGSRSKAMLEAQASLDLLMMVMTSGKEREEHEWRKIFMDAGFMHYRARPVLGFLSIIELYP